MTQKAVIYARVSSVKQATQGDGLSSQETRCREYAKFHNYEVVRVFTDDLSGSLEKRPGMKAMLTYLVKHRKDQTVVIIDDISRLARGVEAHLRLRHAIDKAGGKLESPTLEFGEDSDAQLVEMLLASVSQHQRQKNAEQTKNRMRSRMMNGYWVFQAPVGYRYESVSGQGRMLVPNEPLASIMKEALEGFASGRLSTQTEVMRFLEQHADFMAAQPKAGLRNQRIKEWLTQPLYAGYLENPDWNITLRQAQHEPLISWTQFQRIQERLNERARVPARADLSDDFPLRGFILCGDCDKPLTAYWTKGKTKHYPYYLCFNTSCPSNRKSIPKAEIEGAFEEMLQKMQPSRSLFKLAATMFEELYQNAAKNLRKRIDGAHKQVHAMDQKIEKVVDRIVDASNDTMISALEQRLASLESEKAILAEKAQDMAKPRGTFEEKFELAMRFLGNPYKLWTCGSLKEKRLVLKLTFARNLAYIRKQGFRTPYLSLPFKLLSELPSPDLKMARPEGFEPPTAWFVARYSIQLSYGRI